MHQNHACIIHINVIRMHCTDSSIFCFVQHVQIIHLYVEMDLVSSLRHYVMGLMTASMEVMKRIAVKYFTNSMNYHIFNGRLCGESLSYFVHWRYCNQTVQWKFWTTWGALSSRMGHSLWMELWRCWCKSGLHPAWFSVSGWYFMKKMISPFWMLKEWNNIHEIHLQP